MVGEKGGGKAEYLEKGRVYHSDSMKGTVSKGERRERTTWSRPVKPWETGLERRVTMAN